MIGDTAIDLFNRAKAFFEGDDFEAARDTIHRLNDLDFAFAKVTTGQSIGSRVAIAIVSYKSVPETRALIQQLAPLADNPDYHFVLVSNAGEDLYPYAGEIIPNGRFKSIVMGGNFGASLGRNAAIHHCTSEFITFIDDDGITDPDSILALVSTRDRYDATAVRGKVVALTEGAEVPAHYDMGKSVVQRFMDIEGMTLWRTSALRLEQFDPLLYGHEGAELTVRLYRHFGREAFLYEPAAVLRHDFASSPADADVKRTRMERNDRYISLLRPEAQKVKGVFYKVKYDTMAATLLSMREQMTRAPRPNEATSVTFVTTCYNGAFFLPEYLASLTGQTVQNFKVVFVDDGSTDGSFETFQSMTADDGRFKLYQTDHVGRAAALNVALSHVDTEYALIADVDDISVPQRVEWTLKAYEMYPGSDVIGFNIFDNNSAARAARPLITRPIPMEVRRFFGMPCPFPGLSFRTSSFKAPFNEGLQAGIDCNWLSDNFERHSLRGWYLPIGVTYYRTHDGQITASKRDTQREVALRCVRKLHETLLGPLSDEEISDLEVFTGWTPMNFGSQWQRAKAYADRLSSRAIHGNLEFGATLVDEIARHLNERHESLLKSDYDKVKKSANALSKTAAEADDRAKAKHTETQELKKELKSANNKLAWNRSRIKDMEAQLKKLEARERRDSWYVRIALGTSALLSLGYVLPSFM